LLTESFYKNYLFSVTSLWCTFVNPFLVVHPTHILVHPRVHVAHQRCSDSDFSLSDPILFLKNDIRIRSESCLGWNHTIRNRKLSESVLWCTTYIFVLCLFCLTMQNNIGVILPSAEHIAWSSHMTSLERMYCLVEHDICNSSDLCMDDGCHGFLAGKQLATSC